MKTTTSNPYPPVPANGSMWSTSTTKIDWQTAFLNAVDVLIEKGLTLEAAIDGANRIIAAAKNIEN